MESYSNMPVPVQNIYHLHLQLHLQHLMYFHNEQGQKNKKWNIFCNKPSNNPQNITTLIRKKWIWQNWPKETRDNNQIHEFSIINGIFKANWNWEWRSNNSMSTSESKSLYSTSYIAHMCYMLYIACMCYMLYIALYLEQRCQTYGPRAGYGYKMEYYLKRFFVRPACMWLNTRKNLYV